MRQQRKTVEPIFSAENSAPVQQQSPVDSPPIPGDVATIGDEIIGQMPEVQEHAIAQREQQEAEADANAERDINGTAFDPALHTGSKLKSGAWRTRKNAATNPGSSVAASRKKSVTRGADFAPAVDNTNAEKIAAANAAGAMAASAVFMMCRGFGGKEWEPSETEVAMQSSAWGAYFYAKDISDVPPGMMLCIALGSYAGPRFQMPETKAKVSPVKTWVALRVARSRLKKELKKRGINARVTIEDGVLKVDGKEPSAVLA